MGLEKRLSKLTQPEMATVAQGQRIRSRLAELDSEAVAGANAVLFPVPAEFHPTNGPASVDRQFSQRLDPDWRRKAMVAALSGYLFAQPLAEGPACRTPMMRRNERCCALQGECSPGGAPLDRGASKFRPAVTLPDGPEAVERANFGIVERLGASDQEMVHPTVAVAILGQEECMLMPPFRGRTVGALAAKPE